MSEIWKNIVEFEDLYQVSSFGNIRRHPDKQSKNKYRKPKELVRKTAINYLGYAYATLCKNNCPVKKTVHQLVAAAFIPGFKYGMVVNHLDGNKLNNSVSNLEKVTYQDNNLHAHKTGLMPKPGKSIYRNVYISLKRDQVTPVYFAKVKDMYKTVFYQRCESEIEAAKAVDKYLDSINDTKRGRNFPTS